MDVLAGLNPEQRRAAEAVRGPVCILAGAGSGKTTTITHRIAHQVGTEAFHPGEILAVTFTDKAAGELRARLERLRRPASPRAPSTPPRSRSCASPRSASASSSRPRHCRCATSCGRYPAPTASVRSPTSPQRSSGQRTAASRPSATAGSSATTSRPSRLTSCTGSTSATKRASARRGSSTSRISSSWRSAPTRRTIEALAIFRERYRAFTVDEYQDVNLLQQTLLDLWLGARDDLCVVGDDYQSIYAFTGASPEHLLGMPSRFPNATVVRLEQNYRSTPQVLKLANRLVPRLGGAEKTLRATRPDGPEPELVQASDEGAFVVERIRALDVPHEEIAILCRTNARLTDFESALAAAGIPHQGSSFLARDAARFVLRKLDSPADVRRLALDAGWQESEHNGLGERELVRQRDLGRLVGLAEELAELDGPPSSRSWNGASATVASHAAESIC